jgi:mRNA-degrading endonuclease RelE of RelBE toxin-antitoxin system
MGRDTRERILRRLDQLGESPRDARTSSLLTNLAGLRRVIFAVDDDTRIVNVVTIERRGQVYRRI